MRDFLWSRRESNPRPHKPLPCFLHAYSVIRFSTLCCPRTNYTKLSFTKFRNKPEACLFLDLHLWSPFAGRRKSRLPRDFLPSDLVGTWLKPYYYSGLSSKCEVIFAIYWSWCMRFTSYAPALGMLTRLRILLSNPVDPVIFFCKITHKSPYLQISFLFCPSQR